VSESDHRCRVKIVTHRTSNVNARLPADLTFFVRANQVHQRRGAPAAWLINLRVSKMGGLLRSLDVVKAARLAGIGIFL
jgi:hypothetical protein